MADRAAIGVDLADVFADPGRRRFLTTLGWGDGLEVLETTPEHLRLRTVRYETRADGSILPVDTEAFIAPARSARRPDGSKLTAADVVVPQAENRVLKVNFVDVQQGDGAVIESPDGKIILVDGGDNQLFARYLAARFRGTSPDRPLPVEAILVTHGDADHFAGLREIFQSEQNAEPRKRLFIAPRRVFHNGLVKRPSTDGRGKKRPEKELLGPTASVGGQTILTGLVDDLLAVPQAEMNLPFRRWQEALAAWNARRPIHFRRLFFGADDAFDFFQAPDREIAVLGPLPTQIGGVSGLKFLGNPPKGPRVGHESLATDPAGFRGHSAAHTINGHSVVFRLRYGGFSYLFAGDLNEEAGRFLAAKHRAGELNLRAEVFKAPHHGSADFSGAFLEAVAPVVSVVSSGDESARQEYIHPRATLMGALGRHSRVPEPLIFVTELAAFFNTEGWARLADPVKHARRGEFFAFSRTAYGIVKTRTDGRRLLVFTDSGKADMKEAYAVALDGSGQPVPAPVLRV
jgi:beta-lactamase superfamily II metal-dependent hydrolase